MRSAEPTIVEPQSGFRLVNWRELWAYRDLIFLLVRRDIRVRYVQSVLGFSWALIRPLATMLVFSVIFGRLAQVPSDGAPYPIFSYAAVVPWTYFSSSLTASSGSLLGNALISKVYFPRLIVPLTPVLSNLFDFAIALLMMGVLMVRFETAPTADLIYLPLLVLLMILTASGLGMWFSALAVQYRDVKYGLDFVVQLLMYAAPVVWPASLIPEQYRVLYGLYPMAGVIEGFRSALIGTNPMPWDLIVPGTIMSIIVWVTGAIYFRQRERLFADIF